MTWIRGPVWDLCWIWSSIPIGVSIIFMPPHARVWFFGVALMAETAHRLSPIALAWLHREFRQREVAQNLQWYVGLPIAIMAASLYVGTQFPASYLIKTYMLFNAVHFGLQNFGLLSLYKRRRSRDAVERAADMQACLVVTITCTFLMPMLHLPPMVALALGMSFSVNHWMTEIALTNKASARSTFPLILLGLGLAGFALYYPTDHGHSYQSYDGIPLSVIGSFALGLSFVHFIYDRWIWKFSRRNVRETIGLSLMARANGGIHH